MNSSLVRVGVPVHLVAGIDAAMSFAYTLEFAWAPAVDAYLTRRVWYITGSAVMCVCMAGLFAAPWNAATVPLMTVLAFASSSAGAIAAVATKGIMAYDVASAQLPAASGFYTAGNIGKTVAGAGTLWLLTHLASRAAAATISTGVAVLAGSAILFALPRARTPARGLAALLRDTLLDLWAYLRTPNGALIAVLCVIPFGTGTALTGAIAREWAVSPDQLALYATLGAPMSLGGAMLGAWLSTRIGSLNAYLLIGWSLILLTLGLAGSPRAAVYFFALELCFRALATASYATLLSLVMRTIGQGAASTKAAAMWSLANLSATYPTLIEGAVHDRAGSSAMLLTDAGLAIAGFGVLIAAIRLLKPRFDVLAATAATATPDN